MAFNMDRDHAPVYTYTLPVSPAALLTGCVCQRLQLTPRGLARGQAGGIEARGWGELQIISPVRLEAGHRLF